jgi:hypothetical protein
VAETLPVLRSLFSSNNLRAMPRWWIVLGFGGSVLAGLSCNDETVEVVDKTVCYSEMRWVGEKRGSPEMFPGRDCVGCHIDNDGPPLALGGTIYPYVLGSGQPGLLAQTGTDCFGLEGVEIIIEDGEGQQFALTTNRAGNFYVEGNPDDFAKPFSAVINWTNPRDGTTKISPMAATTPSYGGCANCHDSSLDPIEDRYTPDPDTESEDKAVSPIARIGLPGYGVVDSRFESIDAELNYAGCQMMAPSERPRACERLFEDYGPPTMGADPE